MGRAFLWVIVAASVGGCGGKDAVVTPDGTFQVPGRARLKGGGDRIYSIQFENGCEYFSSGEKIDLGRHRVDRGRHLFYVERAGPCQRTWVDSRHLVPEAHK